MFTKFDKNSPRRSPLSRNSPASSPFILNTPQTADSEASKYAPVKPPKERLHNFLLVKNLPPNVSVQTVRQLFPNAQTLCDVQITPNTSNIYVKFADIKEIKEIVEDNEHSPLELDGKRLKMCLVSKLPLDLNEKSKILLVTLYNEKMEIDALSVHNIFREFGNIRKIIIFKKKNYQVFIEFETPDDASFFKQALHNVNYKGLFFLKIQFTQKNSLIVQSNNLYEHDFTRDAKRLRAPQTTDFTFHITQNKVNINNHIINNNIVTSLGNFNINDLSKMGNSSIRIDKFPSTSSPTGRQPEAAASYFPIRATNLQAEIKHKALFNLFSLYGNIDKISVDSLTNSAVIFYAIEFDQITAYHHLNGINLFGKLLCLEPLKESVLQTKSRSQFKGDKDSSEDSELPNTVFYRKNKETSVLEFQHKQKTINKPGRILYIFNLTKAVNLQMISDLFNTFAQVLDVYYLNDSRNSALCFFESTEAAVKVLCLFKNMNLVDKSLKINFANDNLIRENERDRKRNNEVLKSLQSLEENGPNEVSPMLDPLQLKHANSDNCFKLFKNKEAGLPLSITPFTIKESGFKLFSNNKDIEYF